MSKYSSERVFGPYYSAERGTWRVVIQRADGARTARTFADEATAREVIEAAKRSSENRTLGDAVTAYLESLRTNGARESTISTTRMRLFGVLRLGDRDRPLRSVTPKVAAKLYAARVADGVSAATHRGELGCAVRLFEHCRKRGWVAVNPFETVEAIGTPGRGKPQLRVDEARRLMAVLLADPSPAATAVMAALTTGLRASEVVQLVGRDIDDNGRLLWVTMSKTEAGKRQLRIPSALRARLLELVRGPADRLFSFDRYTLWARTVEYAKQAGVPRVTPHGLRGTFATLAITGAAVTPDMSQVMSPQALAPQFGHGDGGATMRRHYLAPGAEESANSARVESVLASEKTEAVLTPSDLN